MTEVVGLLGYAQSGKDTAAAVLVEEFGFTRIAFADALREVALAINPLIQFSEFELGATDIPESTSTDGGRTVRLQWLVDAIGWDNAKVDYPEVRRLLQVIGTEAGRDVHGQDVWVNVALAKMRSGGRYVFTDVRFPNEFKALAQQFDARLWRVSRPGTTPVNGHASETALDAYNVDWVLENDSDMASFQRRVRLIATGAFGVGRVD